MREAEILAKMICITSDVSLSRKNGTIHLTGKKDGRKALVPVVQTSEIFALSGAEPDEPLLSLLSQYAIPLHIFDNGIHLASYLPSAAVLSGKTVLAQAKHLENNITRWNLAKEMLRGAARLRCMASRILKPKEKENWENKYLDCLAEGYAAGISGIKETQETMEKIDEEFLKNDNWTDKTLQYARGISKAVVLGSLSKLSLDPWLEILSCDDNLPPLACDLLFIFTPLLTWLWPHKNRPRPERENLPALLRSHLSLPAASNGGRNWSLRYLSVREGYALISHFANGRPYRCASKVEVKGNAN